MDGFEYNDLLFMVQFLLFIYILHISGKCRTCMHWTLLTILLVQ